MLYIDGNDVNSEGTFVSSVSGTGLSYTNWRDGEPNNSGDEDCIYMQSTDGLWNDYLCTSTLPAVCEIERRKSRGDAQMFTFVEHNFKTNTIIIANRQSHPLYLPLFSRVRRKKWEFVLRHLP